MNYLRVNFQGQRSVPAEALKGHQETSPKNNKCEYIKSEFSGIDVFSRNIFGRIQRAIPGEALRMIFSKDSRTMK